MVEPLRHRQTKEAETDMFGLPPPRHISTPPKSGSVCGGSRMTERYCTAVRAGASANCAALRPASRPKVAPDIRPVPLA
jgi:hypothetical protein